VTVFSAVPTIYYRLIAAWDAAPAAQQRAWSDGARPRAAHDVGSAALPARTLERWREITGHTLLERYGMTETGMILSNPLHGERRPGTSARRCPASRSASWTARSKSRPGVFSRILGRPERRARRFATAGSARATSRSVEDGAYRLLGRTSVDIIKTGGYKVSALEIEDASASIPRRRDCAVVGAPDEDWGQRVRRLVELRPDARLTLDELRASLRERLAPTNSPRTCTS
jgi:malonyl-CoA/methylmalonyl-CoA synthetase